MTINVYVIVYVFLFRVCLPPEPFVVVLFSTLHSKPEFYECVTVDGRCHLDFALSTWQDVIQLNRVCSA